MTSMKGCRRADLIALMVGRPIDTEYPVRPGLASSDIVLSAKELTGSRFHDVASRCSPRRNPRICRLGRKWTARSAARAWRSRRGERTGALRRSAGQSRSAARAPSMLAFFRSAPTARQNRFSRTGRSREHDRPGARRFRPRRVDLRAQGTGEHARAHRKTQHRRRRISISRSAAFPAAINRRRCLARSFLYDAKAMLIDEPTQGVDAKARFDIYRAIRAKADQGVACVINSSDAMELAGICDRVLVFSRGRVIRELSGGEITEESIVSSFLRPRKSQPLRKRRSMRRDATGFRSPISANWSPAAATSGGCRCCSCCS